MYKFVSVFITIFVCFIWQKFELVGREDGTLGRHSVSEIRKDADGAQITLDYEGKSATIRVSLYKDIRKKILDLP